MATTKEYVEGHYEVEDIPYRKVYRWVPGHNLEGKALLREDEAYRPER